LWNILTIHGGRGGYSRHPETLRWKGRLRALFLRHEGLAAEFERRGYHHRTPLDRRLASGDSRQKALLDSLTSQRRLLRSKRCGCLGHRGSVA